MEVILKRVPYCFTSSKASDVKRDEIRGRASTIACLSMAMNYLAPPGAQIPSIDDLFQESEIIQKDLLERGLLTEKTLSPGRLHSSVVWVAHNHGVTAHTEEFRSTKVGLRDGSFSKSDHEEKMYKAGLERICWSIAHNSPVIVSVGPMSGKSKGSNSILIVGFERDGEDIFAFYFHDPDNPDIHPATEEVISVAGFHEAWRRIAIFIDSLRVF